MAKSEGPPVRELADAVSGAIEQSRAWGPLLRLSAACGNRESIAQCLRKISDDAAIVARWRDRFVPATDTPGYDRAAVDAGVEGVPTLEAAERLREAAAVGPMIEAALGEYGATLDTLDEMPGPDLLAVVDTLCDVLASLPPVDPGRLRADLRRVVAVVGEGCPGADSDRTGPDSYTDREMRDRDRFIYQQKRLGKTNRQIIKALEEKSPPNNWEPLGTPESIRKAVNRYTKLAGAEPLPGGKPGRPRGKTPNP